MAKDKKPSIFADRGTIGSSDELDEYGVWVKSEPQDLSQASPEADGFSIEMPESDDIDAVIPNFDDLPDFDTFGAISPDSDISANIPDISDITEDDLDLPDLKSDSKTTEEDNDSDVFNFGDLTESVELNSMDLDSENLGSVELETTIPSAEPEAIEPNAPDSVDDEGFNEISMDELIGTQDSPDSINSEEPIEPDSDTANTIAEAPVFAAEPENIVSKASDFQPVQSGEKETVKEKQGLDLSTQLLMKIAEELSSIRSELSTLKKEFSGFRTIATPKAEGKENELLEEEDDEKISLTGDELNNILNTADFTEEAGSDAASAISDNEDDSDELNLSTADLDMEIDLSDSNLENLEGETKLGNSSFIDIDIADSVEPSGSLESPGPLGSAESSELLESGEDSQIQSDIEIPADMPISEDSIIDFSSDATDELNEIREKGVEPMVVAPPPEDTDYLHEDPMAENIESEELPPELPEESADEGIDLSEAVIDEPDLSSEIHDNPLEEPSLEDISISLDLSDLNSINLDSGGADSVEIESAENDAVLPITEDTVQAENDLSQIPEELTVEENDISGILENGVTLNEIAEKLPEETIEEIPEETIEEFPSVSDTDDSAAVVPDDDIAEAQSSKQEITEIPANLKTELKTVLSYMDQLLEALPDEKIEEFAKSDYYDTYKKLFKELGLA